jgi:NADH-quinone oxidoreductase subunit E
MSSSHVLSENARQEIDKWVAKYPVGQQKSAICAAIKIVQEENGGHIDESRLHAIADHLNISKIEALEVASFYDMVETKPIGRYKLSVCTNVSCMLCGCGPIVEHLENRLGVKMGETTKDGLFTLREVECLAACVGAPMLQVNDKEFHEKLTVEKLDALLNDLITQAGGNP